MLLRVATPAGAVTPASGPHKDVSTSYADHRDKHTQVADQSLANMLSAYTASLTGTVPADAGLRTFVTKKGVGSYGSQLSSEGLASYGALVKAALEAAPSARATAIHTTAATDIGVNIMTMAATKNYGINKDVDRDCWHLFPR